MYKIESIFLNDAVYVVLLTSYMVAVLQHNGMAPIKKKRELMCSSQGSSVFLSFGTRCLFPELFRNVGMFLLNVGAH